MERAGLPLEGCRGLIAKLGDPAVTAVAHNVPSCPGSVVDLTDLAPPVLRRHDSAARRAQTKSGPMTTLSTTPAVPSRTRLESHHTPALRMLHGRSSPASNVAATSPSVG